MRVVNKCLEPCEACDGCIAAHEYDFHQRISMRDRHISEMRRRLDNASAERADLTSELQHEREERRLALLAHANASEERAQFAEENHALTSEVERLRAHNDSLLLSAKVPSPDPSIGELEVENHALRREAERLRGERDRARAAVADVARELQRGNGGWPASAWAVKMRIHNLIAKLDVALLDPDGRWTDAARKIAAELDAAAPPESEPAPSEPEALREARWALKKIRGHIADDKPPETNPPRNRLQAALCVAETWLARHPGPQPEDQ